VSYHDVLSVARLLATGPPVGRGTADQQEEQRTCLHTYHHTRKEPAPSAPANREAQATRDDTRPLAP